MSQTPEFKEGEEYKLAYKPFTHKEGLDENLVCPKCDNTVWKYQATTGSKSLGKEHMKLKCTSCGQYFICLKSQVTKVLGG